ncbi:MAG: zinc ribbon domain-containing protein, partial [Desulfurivibrionaceae bacterium]|nr:zinc ribbon domain-containing protein [Desulfurivibrionaceae bacterium]
MPVYEYECQSCEEVTEIWQHLADEPVASCPSCKGQVKKIISMSSFQLKGGGWYTDGYSSASPAAKSAID